MIPLVDVLKRSEAFLRGKGVPSPRLEAERLLGHALGLDRVKLYLNFDRPLDEAELEQIRALIARRGRREPLGWILGEVGFWTLDLAVHKGVLVPRPDTETLVRVALELLPTEGPCYIADLGCGTGAIGLAILSERPEAMLYAVDLSPEALANTRENIARLGFEKRVGLLQGSWLDPIPAHRRIDLVLSNPPYITTAVLETLEPEVQAHEPRLALDGGPDGLAPYRALLPQAAARARIGVAVEIGHDQGPAVSALFHQSGIEDIKLSRDLNDNDRVISGRTSA